MLANEWRRALEADNRSVNTVRIYVHSVRMLGEWAMSQDPDNAHNNYRSIRTFFGWLVDEGAKSASSTSRSVISWRRLPDARPRWPPVR